MGTEREPGPATDAMLEWAKLTIRGVRSYAFGFKRLLADFIAEWEPDDSPKLCQHGIKLGQWCSECDSWENRPESQPKREEPR